MNQTQIEWSQAIEQGRTAAERKKEMEREYRENLNTAHVEMWEALGDKHFMYQDFEQICFDNEIEQDDLINRLI